MSYQFQVGQKVVCVDDEFARGNRHPDISNGRVYRVSSITSSCLGGQGRYVGTPGVRLEGIDYHTCDDGIICGDWHGYFGAARFRPVQTKSTDISIFKALLTPTKAKQAELS